MADLRSSFLKSLSGLPNGRLGGGAPAYSTGGEDGTLSPARPRDTDPRSMAGDKILLDPGLVANAEKRVKPGDELNILAEVVSVGDKIVLTPLEVSANNPEERDGFHTGAQGSGGERTAPGGPEESGNY